MDVERAIESMLGALRQLTDSHVTIVGDVRDLRDVVQGLAANQLGLAERQTQLHGHLTELRDVVFELAQRQVEQHSQLGELRTVVTELARIQKDSTERTERRFAEMSEKVEDLTQNMNALIRVVDDLIRRDGRQQ